MHRVDSETQSQTLDVRAVDGEPFGRIMAAVDELADDESLLLINHFEPVPLYEVLDRRGYDHETVHVADDEWHVTITAK